MKMETDSICESCFRLKNLNHYLDHEGLPVWYLKNIPQFHLPEQLKDLSTAEKLRIKLISPFVPLTHIENGRTGLQGHVCAFEQDIEGFGRHLLREKKDVNMLRVVQSVRNEIGCSSRQQKIFRVRRLQILEALHWLKEFNPLHGHIEIVSDALNWLDDDEEVPLVTDLIENPKLQVERSK
jgi:hypothetical protein